MVEAFGRAIKKAYYDGKIRGIIVIKNVANITHQQYADDTILLGESTINEALNINMIIQQYVEASGQKVNVEKLEIFLINTKIEMKKYICNIVRYKKGTFPCKYLGMEIEKGYKSRKRMA